MSAVDEKLQLLEPFLQQNVSFCLGTKNVRKGKLLLYNIKDYYIKFTIRTNKDVNKVYEIPYPYDIVNVNEGVKMSYKINTLCNGNNTKEQLLREYGDGSTNKLYNSNITIVNID